MATEWPGPWLGGWPGTWDGTGEGGGSGSFADMAAVGGGTATGFASIKATARLAAVGFAGATGFVGTAAPPAVVGGGGGRSLLINMPRPRKRGRVVNMAAVGRVQVQATARIETLFDVRGVIARRIFVQRRNLALALAA